MQEKSQNTETGEKSEVGEGSKVFRLPLTFFSKDIDENKSSKSPFTFKEGTILVDLDLFHCIISIIEKSEEYCFIVTPFLDPFSEWENVWKKFDEADDNGKKLFFILKKPKNNEGLKNEGFKKDLEEDRKKIEIIKKDFNRKFDLFLVDNLHSKIYLNEKHVLITSINFKKYATEKNHEIGCLIDDPDISKQIVNNIIIRMLKKNKNTEHFEGKWADWIKKRISNNNILDDKSDNNDSPSVESSLDESKNDIPDNNDSLLCEPKVDSNNSEDKKQGYCTTNSDNKLLTIRSLLKELLIKSNKEDNVNLLSQLSKQLMNKYTFNRKDRWASDKNMLMRDAKINKDIYEWALENIKL
jgi:hypothetical protein